MCNLAEKVGIIECSRALLEIRDLRNDIAHEYKDAVLNALFESVLEKAPSLVAAIDNAGKYARNLI